MQETHSVSLKQVSPHEIFEFQQMVHAYWQELMPHASVVRDLASREAYFAKRFTVDSDNAFCHWSIVASRKVGFVSYVVSPAHKSATVEDFYVDPAERRKGYGSATVRTLCEQFDKVGVQRIELNVRRDNPDALSFWEAQGFRVALYRLRQYRDPKTGTGFIGSLSSDFATHPS